MTLFEKKIIKQHIDIVCLQETKVDTFSNRMFLSISTPFKSWYFIPAIGSSRGILLGLNNVILDVLSIKMGCFSITVLLRNKWDNFQWALTTLYGPVLLSRKSDFWIELYSLGLWCTGAWVIGGILMLFAFEEKNRVYLLIYVICLLLMIGLIFLICLIIKE
jgi:hypothetical protein